MAIVDLIMPKMGESIMEATILKWLKNVGDTVELDEAILEIATDKVDSEIPSPVEGKITEVLFKENDIVEVGKVIARLATNGEDVEPVPSPAVAEPEETKQENSVVKEVQESKPSAQVLEVISQPLAQSVGSQDFSSADRFYSPLIKNIAKKENISIAVLDSIPGTGKDNRLTKKDLLAYLSAKGNIAHKNIQHPATNPSESESSQVSSKAPVSETKSAPVVSVSGDDEIIQMDRMRKMIADHMVMSKHTSPHVTSFVEADVTNIWNWRNANKKAFAASYGEKLTFTPIFIEAVVKAIKDFPLINITVKEDKIIVKKNINIGMAAALPSGNLIVPVIKNADHLNLGGLARSVNDLANRARGNKLKPDEIQGGTFTLTNVGTFGNVMGTPIINQPQVAILAVGAIRKKPAVVETEYGDLIAIRQMMFLSLSYDHRVVDGFLGGSFLRKVADYLEQFDHNQSI